MSEKRTRGYAAQVDSIFKNCQLQEPLIFVHLGGNVPRYVMENVGRTAVRLMGERTVIMLSDQDLQPKTNLFPVKISDGWYSSSEFEDFKNSVSLDYSFREGFWGRAVERFFVLEQFVRIAGIGAFFHAENDVVVFGLDHLNNALGRRREQSYFCRDDQDRATSALAYFPSTAAIRKLVDWFLGFAGSANNEMEMLATYMDEFPSEVSSFPTLNQLDYNYAPSWGSLGCSGLGIVDAAALGQWVAGKDPRNTLGISWSRFSNETLQIDPSKMRLHLSPDSRSLSVSYQGMHPVRVFAIHIHSKSIAVIKMGWAFRLIQWLGNLQLPLPIRLELVDNQTIDLARRAGKKLLSLVHSK